MAFQIPLLILMVESKDPFSSGKTLSNDTLGSTICWKALNSSKLNGIITESSYDFRKPLIHLRLQLIQSTLK